MGPKLIFSTALTDVKTTDVEGIGRLRYDEDAVTDNSGYDSVGLNVYRWVKNQSTAATGTITVSNAVCHDFTLGSTALGFATVPATALLGFLGGIAMATIAPNTGTNPACYGWIQVKGIARGVPVTPVNTQTTNSPIAGATLKAVNAVGYLAIDSAMGTAPIYTRGCLLLDIVTPVNPLAVQACNVYVNCL